MSLASQGRRLPFPPLDRLVGQGSETVGGDVEDGISSPLFITSTPLSGSDFPSQLLNVRRASSILSGVLQPPICNVEGVGFVEACDRSVSPERVCAADSLQDGVQPVGSQFHLER